jgi:Ni,Fe-hydrogenase III large subunit
MITTGVLTKEEAKDATGLVRRASGWDKHDFRLRHPQGIYKHPKVQEMLRATITLESEEHHNRTLPIFPYHLQGDVFARMAMRVAEVETSATIISYLIAKLQALDPTAPTHVPINDRLRETQNLEFGIGYVEGWRGDIFYWVMKGPNNTIFRCQVRDPSLFNWHVFPLVVVRKLKKEDGSSGYWENILADFPLINKSFNLSYAGHDR